MHPQNDELTQQITQDLIAKTSDDMQRLLARIIAVAPGPHLPIFVQAAATAIITIAANMPKAPTKDAASESDALMFSALIVGRSAILGSFTNDAVAEAINDFNVLAAAKRV